MAVQRLRIEGHTARKNELLKVHWRVAQGLRKRDDALIALAALSQYCRLAEGKRRVSLFVTLGPRQRADEDCWWKSILDALVNARLLKNDSSKWCKLGDVTHVNGKKPSIEIILEDLYESESDAGGDTENPAIVGDGDETLVHGDGVGETGKRNRRSRAKPGRATKREGT